MSVEIERKFLVLDESWRAFCHKSQHIRDALVAASDGRKARVRICDGQATLAVKIGKGKFRFEFEYPIPLKDAEELIFIHCAGKSVEKTRHHIRHAGLTWHVDVYHGVMAGVTIAEVELASVDTFVPLPPWIGAEVTGDPAYSKGEMLNVRLARLAALENGVSFLG